MPTQFIDITRPWIEVVEKTGMTSTGVEYTVSQQTPDFVFRVTGIDFEAFDDDGAIIESDASRGRFTLSMRKSGGANQTFMKAPTDMFALRRWSNQQGWPGLRLVPRDKIDYTFVVTQHNTTNLDLTSFGVRLLLMGYHELVDPNEIKGRNI